MTATYTHSGGNNGTPLILLAGRESLLHQLQSTLLEEGSGVFLTSQISHSGNLINDLGKHLADTVSPHFEGSVYSVNLHGYDPLSHVPVDPSQAQRYILSQIIPPHEIPQDSRALTRLYRDTLGKRNALILLLDAADPQQVRYLIPRKGSKVIITSMHDLSGSFPKLQPQFVSGIASADAYQLLVSISPRALLQNKRTIIKLCEFLDNSPLTIAVLAPLLEDATRISPRELVNRYKTTRQRVQSLRGEAPTTFDCAMELAFDALSPKERMRLALLAVFPGAFSFYAARIIWNTNQADANNTLRVLIQRNLVMTLSQNLLTQNWAVRRYAQGRLLAQPGMAADVTQRYIHYSFQQTLPETNSSFDAQNTLSTHAIASINDHLTHAWLRSNNQAPGWAKVTIDAQVRISAFLRLSGTLQAVLTQEIFTQWLDTAILLAQSINDSTTTTQLMQLRLS